MDRSPEGSIKIHSMYDIVYEVSKMSNTCIVCLRVHYYLLLGFIKQHVHKKTWPGSQRCSPNKVETVQDRVSWVNVPLVLETLWEFLPRLLVILGAPWASFSLTRLKDSAEGSYSMRRFGSTIRLVHSNVMRLI